MNSKKVFLWSLVVALGGFLFGFDTAVISGAEQSIQQYWQLNPFKHGLTVSIALIGTVVGALSGSIPSDRLGRRKTLMLIAFIYLVSSVSTALSTNGSLFLFFRFLDGLGVGASSVTVPVYISEISPSHSRGKLVGLFQFNVVLGVLISYLSNYIIGRYGESSWRWMLGVQAFPSLLYVILLRYIPESPRWLYLKKGKIEEAKEVMKIINPDNYEQEFQEIKKNNEEEQKSGSATALFSKRYKFPIFLAIIFAVFNQLSGINAIAYYAPRIFEMTGLSRQSALLSTVGIGLINFIFTLLAVNYIDKFGRKALMLIGSIGLIVTLGLVAQAFFSHQFVGYRIIICLLIYIAFFAFSQGAVIWVFISEIFPNQVRAKGQTLGSFTHWIFAAIIAFSFPIVVKKLGGGPAFAFFTFMMVLQLIFVLKIMPETKGKSLENIERTLVLH